MKGYWSMAQGKRRQHFILFAENTVLPIRGTACGQNVFPDLAREPGIRCQACERRVHNGRAEQ